MSIRQRIYMMIMHLSWITIWFLGNTLREKISVVYDYLLFGVAGSIAVISTVIIVTKFKMKRKL